MFKPSFPTLRWTSDDIALLTKAEFDQSAPFGRDDVRLAGEGLDVWDAWPLADPNGEPIVWQEGEIWFALTVSRSDNPETRHHLARIHHFHLLDGRFYHLGQTIPDGMAPGSRQWSGSARLDGDVITLFFTASGKEEERQPTYHQRIFSTTSRFDRGQLFSEWTKPIEIVKADGVHYQAADQDDGEPGKIKAFRDPAHFRDADGSDYVLFTGSSAREPSPHDGVVGLAKLQPNGTYAMRPPLVEALGVNNELERPHLVKHDDNLYLFWCTQRGVFAPGLVAPTGLYGAVAPSLRGPWKLLNSHGLVFANPRENPTQAYSWWVLPDLRVTSFVDYWGPEDDEIPELKSRRQRFGGTFAPFEKIWLDGDRAGLVND